MLMRKSPELRPSLRRVQKLIKVGLEIAREPTKEFEALASISAQLSEQHAKEEAEREALRLKKEKRDQLAREAVQVLQTIYGQLMVKISHAAPQVAQSGNTIVLGEGSLELAIRTNESVPSGIFRRSGWDVVSEAQIFVRQHDNNNPVGSLLIYAKRGGGKSDLMVALSLVNDSDIMLL
jgi:hypothetical protein